MCRLFGLIANKEVDIRFSMLEARNKFKEQGRTNYHGWGIGWYEKGMAKIEKYGESAFESERFDALVKELVSRIFIAHVRLASSGSRADKNAHPFLYKNWLFAHNGTINCDKMLRELLIEPYNKDFTSEPIDSEIYFRFIIQNIEKEGDIIQGIKNAVKIVVPGASGANFILSDGESIYGFKYGKELYFLSRDPNSLSSTSKVTGALIESKRLLDEKAVIIASEKLTDERWQEVKEGELIIVNSKLEIRREVLL